MTTTHHIHTIFDDNDDAGARDGYGMGMEVGSILKEHLVLVPSSIFLHYTLIPHHITITPFQSSAYLSIVLLYFVTG